MRIIELRATNIKRIKAVEIRPKDNVVVISGKNDQGKTSVLDSIWYTLAGKDSLKGTPVPIRKGAKSAETQLDLGDFLVTRRWTSNDKSYLEVTGKDGLQRSPQQLIDSFVGKLSFDPLEFANMKEKDQRELLLNLIDLDINLDQVDTKIGVLYDQRRLKGREVKLLQGQREDVEEGLPDELVSLSKLQEELENARENNEKYLRAKEDIKQAETEIKHLEEKIEWLKGSIKQNEKVIQKRAFISVDPIKQKIASAEIINEKIRARERNKEADKKLQQVQAEYDSYTKQIEDLTNDKKEALDKATMPIAGLGIDDNGITYNNFPFSQLSSSEQLKVSMAIAMAFNPKLKIVLIRDGSLLDDNNMKLIREMAKEKDLQAWIEKVEDQSGTAFIIEDGEIKK